MKIPSRRLMALDQFDRHIPHLQKQPASVKELERNERLGTISMQTLVRAADALNADLVYAIIPRMPCLRDQSRENSRSYGISEELLT